MAGEDRAYTDWLHGQPCQAPLHVCGGPIVVHHPRHLAATGHDKRRAHDHHGVTLCDWSHKALHQLAPNGPFRGMQRDQVRGFCENAAAANRARYLGEAPPDVSLGALAVEREPFPW